tara:strand:+ start:4825 stop:7206 length:2382 start_codon:yes stop_codon:yes gene_type:complete
MDLQQNKLTKSEWESIEIPSTPEEKNIYKLIIKGFHNVNIKENETLSILSFLKLSNTELINNYIFMKYLQPDIQKIYKTNRIKYKPLELNKKTLNKADIIRFEHMEKNLLDKRSQIFDFILIDYIENILKNYQADEDDPIWIKYLYTIKRLLKYDIKCINNHLLDVINNLINYFDDDIDKLSIIKNAKSMIISNTDLIKYNDKVLFSHQKELFTKMKNPRPKMAFYIAPTGTGKTLSPIGLSEKYKIIFVCAVRHVGLALAKAAITMEKCVAFAFGCDSVEDIRLHYFSAKEYTKNRKTGGIFKVDNSVGDKVEIMICDIKSYLYAMRYMLAFNSNDKIILYWDEPTISLDYEEHEFHNIIKTNWAKNEIANIVLSSATLPSIDDLKSTINNYKERFDGDIHSIKNYDCAKSISLINREGFIEAPHYISNDYNKILESVKYIETNKTILRYVDLEACVEFITYINENNLYKNEVFAASDYYNMIEDINIDSIKLYYLILLRNIKVGTWNRCYNYFIKERKQKYKSTTYISTEDAHTLVNGPTIYITQEVDKIAHFCIQCMKIPENEIKNISKAISINSDINKKILVMEKDYEDGLSKEDMKEKKVSNDRGIPQELRTLKNQIETLKNTIRTVTLPDMYVPNKKDHLFKWGHSSIINAFTSDISDYTVEQIMLIDDMDDIWKLLLLMGIGVFSIHTSSRYTEIMKDLAKSKKLYIIIASSDFIYGTNYQFDHCYLGKDLLNMTQEKIIQALGRVGRNKNSDEYTIRIRDNSIISKIFNYEENKPEVINMQKLFS